MNYLIIFILYNFLIINLYFFKHAETQESLQEGNLCLLNSGGVGICKNFDECNLALLADEGTDPRPCLINDEEVIVCCPDTNMSQRNLPFLRNINIPEPSNFHQPTKITKSAPMKLSISSQKCLEYSKIKCESLDAVHTIINGNNVTNIDQYPHMALLGYGDPNNLQNLTWQCGGTLISEQFILTAAHCLIGYDRAVPVVAHLGFLNRQNRNEFGTLQEFQIVEIFKHPDRIDGRTYDDIAILKLDRPVTFSLGVFPACLHEENELPLQAQATGWGDVISGDNTGSDKLMKVTLPILKHEDCAPLYPKNRRLKQGILKAKQFCAGDGNKDTCQGDSGGPLQIIGKNYCIHSIIGVTSFGNNCGLISGVYTKVSYYVPWIESIVWPNSS